MYKMFDYINGFFVTAGSIFLKTLESVFNKFGNIFGNIFENWPTEAIFIRFLLYVF